MDVMRFMLEVKTATDPWYREQQGGAKHLTPARGSEKV